MQTNMNINPREIIAAAVKMPLVDKLELYEKIKDDVMQHRFESFRNDLKETVTLADEEITQIVEDVREENYKNRS